MTTPSENVRPKRAALRQALENVGLIALRVEGEMISPLRVRAMRERRQREYADLAYKFLRNNLDVHYLDDVLDPQTIPAEALAHEVACDYHRRPAQETYLHQLFEWVDSQQITFTQGEYSPDCGQCFDTGCDFHEYVRTGALTDLHNPQQCTQCERGTT